MASNKQVIAKALDTAINSDDPIDLLLISKTLDEINGEQVGSDPDYGMHYNMLYIGMSGQRMVDQMNSNWKATDAQFLAHNEALEIRIISNQIKEIKVENDIPYYTVDGENWISLQGKWGSISGTLLDQTDLADALAEKANLADFNVLKATVSTNSDDIMLIQQDITNITDSINSINTELYGTDGLTLRMTNAEKLLAKKITSETVSQIRTTNGTALEFTTDGINWHPVSSVGQVEWGDVSGDIANQADLQRLLKNLENSITEISTALSEYKKSNNTKVDNHIANTENPHEVTKAQVGLGNVDNTADTNKPVSTPQKEYIDEQFNDLQFKAITATEYDALQAKDSNTLYFIISE